MIKAGRPYIVTSSGAEIDLLDPDPTSITLEDIAYSLARICRFTGHIRRGIELPYSVAQHSVLVARYLENQGHGRLVQACGLMHDAHEAYVGDVASPIKKAIRSLHEDEERNVIGYHGSPKEAANATPTPGPWAALEALHASAVRRRFCLPANLPHAVHAADLALLAVERRDLMVTPAGASEHGWPTPPAGWEKHTTIVPWDWCSALELFRLEAERLGVL